MEIIRVGRDEVVGGRSPILSGLIAVSVLLAAEFLIFFASCSTKPIEKSPDARPALTQAASANDNSAKTIAAQLAALKADNQTLAKQNTELQKAIDDATSTGDAIDKAEGQRAKASAQASAIAAAVATLADQKASLADAKARNADLQTQLDQAKKDNAALTEQNTAAKLRIASLTSDNATIRTQLATAISQVAQGETEKDALRADNKKLADKIASGEREKEDFYFGLSIAALIAGIAAIIWVPAPAKTIGYVLATVGAAGLAVTIFLIAWMAFLKWIVLAGVVGGLGYIAYQLFVNHGALTKTAEGVQGMKEDLATLANSSPVQAVKTEAAKIYTDYFGSITTSGIFHWLHSEYASLITRIRKLIGSPATAKVASPAATPNFLTTTLTPITPATGAA